jgi:HAE1 family hydrophobic/amphiphilic exporter-1
MTWFTKWSFKNKAAMWLLVVLTLLIGTVSYMKLPLEFFPEAELKQITITTMGQGYDASAMLKNVTKPVEKAAENIEGKTEVLSTTGNGFSKIDVLFDAKTDMSKAKAELNEALTDVKLPEGIGKPYVLLLKSSMIPVSQVSVAFEDGMTKENTETIEEKIVPALEKVKGAAGAAMLGNSSNQVSVKLDQEKLAEKGIPVHAVMSLLQGKNYAAAVSEKTIDGKSSNIKVVGQIDGISELEKLTVVPNVQLKDIASIEIEKGSTGITRINGEESILVRIMKEGGYNSVTIGKDIEKTVAELNKKVDGLKTEVVWSNADQVVTSVNSMLKEVGLGALFATLVILLFLRNLRTTFITIVSIPLSLGLTVFLLWQSGITLNVMTLGGVAVAVGRLVDDSIVVIESIFRKAQKGIKLNREMVTNATKEVSGAITSSTLTTVAVFLPLGIVSGSLQDFLLPFALTVTYALLSSLLVAITVVPVMSATLLKNAQLPEHKEPVRYVRLLAWSLNHKWVALTAAIVLFVGSIGLFSAMPQGAMNASDASLVDVNMKYPARTPISEVQEKALQLESFLVKQKEAKTVLTMQGNTEDGAKYGQVGSETAITYSVIMEKGSDVQHFIDEVKKEKSRYSDADFSVTAISMTGGGSSDVTIDLAGADIEELITAANKVLDKVKDIDGVEKASSNQEETKPSYEIKVNPSSASAQEVAGQLQMLLNPMPIGTVNLDGKEAKVVMETDFNPSSQRDLENIMVAAGGKVIPLTQAASFVKTEEASMLFQKDGEQYVRVTLQIDPDKLSAIKKDIAKAETELKLPDGVEMNVGGATETQEKENADMLTTMLASIGLVYLIMVLTFKTLRAPLAILFSLPLAAVGAVLGLLITKTTVETTAMIGGLMLIGIVVTNAIVLIERVKQNEKTMTIRDSLLEAGAARMRPILMTAIATVCAMLPLVFKSADMGSIVSKGLAIVVIGGLTVSTLLTLVIIPVVYELLHFRKSKRQRKAAEQNREIVA